MENPVISKIIELLEERCKDAFSGFKGKIKLCCIKRKLKKEISNEILSTYGNETYYNDLDHFLVEYDVICNIIRNCCNEPVFNYKSKFQTTSYYVHLFIEKYPRHNPYCYEITFVLQKYFEVIYRTLNKSDDTETQVICNVVKELSYELLDELQSIKIELKHIGKKLDTLVGEQDHPCTRFLFDEYKQYLLCLYPLYPSDEYLERKIYSKDECDIQLNDLDVLLKEKNVLVLGEAGYGKTYESITLLRKICTDDNTQLLIPIFIPLQEYGLLYSDIIGGIKYKISAFCDGRTEEFVEEKLKNGKCVLIFDGIDDIAKEIDRKKFYVEFNNFTTRYSNNYFFVTARFNRYHEELGAKKTYFLTALSEQTVQQELRNEGIFVKIPQQYYTLFSNPYFLSVGKAVLKQSTNRTIFNRSSLFEELFQKLYGDMSRQEGLAGSIPITYHDAQNILGELAYQTFSQPFYSYMEFDQKLSQIVHENKMSVIGSFIESGLFKIEGKVFFVHKLLKEYCVAYYLVHNLPLSGNKELYLKLIEKEEWKEVFIFAGGIFKIQEKQDEFLDFVMEHNLPLYVECVDAKSDVSKTDYTHTLNRILTQIVTTYQFVLNKYFCPISMLFDPFYASDSFSIEKGQKVAIVGYLSKEQNWLGYWFDLVSSDESDVQCIDEKQVEEYQKSFEKKALSQRRKIVIHGTNLKLSGFGEDSGREIAIKLIKDGLKNLLEEKKLIEDKYLLCERVSNCQKKMKKIENIDNLSQMQIVVDKTLDGILENNPHVESCIYDDVELFDLQKILHKLNPYNIVLSKCILPSPDIRLPVKGACFTWDLYSKKQKEQRVSLFFYYHEISYLSMIDYNFPALKKYFRRYNDAPYQVVVEVDYKEDSNPHDFTSEPIIQYYYIASSTNNVPLPTVREIKKENFSDYMQVMQNIQESYKKQGRSVNRLSTTTTGFTFVTTSRRTGKSNPLSDYVYKTIEESLEDVLGPIR